MKNMRWATLFGLGMLFWGCGAAPKPAAVAKPVPVAVTPEQERRPYLEVAPALAAVPLDGVWVRVASVAKTFDELPSLVKGLPQLAPLRNLVEGRAGLLPADVASVVDPAQPVELMLPRGTTPVWAFRVRSPEVIAEGGAGLTLRRRAAGVWDVGGVVAAAEEPPLDDDEEPSDDEDEAEEEEDSSEPSPFEVTGLHCQLHHRPSPVDYRVLCSAEPEAIESAAAFLAASAPAAAASGVHVELAGPSYAAMRERVMASLPPEPESGDAARRAGRQMALDVFQGLFEHDRLTFDVSLEQLHADASLELAFGDDLKSSSFAAWLAQGSRATLPPSFARLPADSALTLGVNLGSGVVDFILDQVEHGIDEETLTSPAEKREVLESLRGVLPSDGRFSLAFNLDVAAALEALNSPAVRLADDADRPLSAASVKELQAASSGVLVLGLEEPPARYLAAVKRAYRIGRKQSKTRPGHEDKNPRSHSELTRLSGAPPGLPRDTLHLVTAVRPERKYVPPADGSAPPILPYEEHFLVVPEGDHVWLVYARSVALATAQAQALLAPRATANGAVPDASVLSAAAQLALFGFGSAHVDSKNERIAARRQLSGVNLAPGRARLPVPLTIQILPRQDASGWRLRLHSHAQLDQLLAQAMSLFMTSE